MIKKSKKKNTDVARDIEKRAKADKKIIKSIMKGIANLFFKINNLNNTLN